MVWEESSVVVGLTQEIPLESREMIRILRDEYTLGELEEYLGLTSQELEDGYEAYVDINYDKVLQLLREELYF